MYMSQEMLKLRRFLARFWLSDNQMTIILEITQKKFCIHIQLDQKNHFGNHL